MPPKDAYVLRMSTNHEVVDYIENACRLCRHAHAYGVVLTAAALMKIPLFKLVG